MSETVVIKDNKKRKVCLMVIVGIYCLLVLTAIHGSKVNNTTLEATGIICSIYFTTLAIYFYPKDDLIKIENGNLYCKSPEIKSKYTSFFGNIKISITEINLIYIDKSMGTIDIYDIDSQKVASIPSLGLFSSKKYIEDVQSYLMQIGIEVKTNAEENNNVYADDETQQIELIERQETISDTENTNSSTDIAFGNDTENRTDTSIKSPNARRRNVVNSSNTSPEIKPSAKQNEHKGRRLELG